MSKRSAPVGLSAILAKQARTDLQTAAENASRVSAPGNIQKNPFLSHPVNPDDAIKLFLMQARRDARRHVPNNGSLPVTKPFCEIEARIGILKSPFGLHDMRVLSSGPKRVNLAGKQGVANAFVCSDQNGSKCSFEGGITRSHFVHWTMAGLSESSPISTAFGIAAGSNGNDIKRDLVEVESVETVYGGYPNDNRVCFPGNFRRNNSKMGKMENKAKLTNTDIAIPSAPYDLRLTLATEVTVDDKVTDPPSGWKTCRLKRRRSYSHRNRNFAWQLDVTEVTTTGTAGDGTAPSMQYEIEMELDAETTLKWVNETEDGRAQEMCKELSRQLWWMLNQINPLSDVLNVDEFLREHPDSNAVRLALAQCGALKRFMDSKGKDWTTAIAENGPSQSPAASLANIKFPGCMPVNFSRHNIEEVQRSEENGYFLSEKTDGVRHLMVFTGNTVVLVDRAMKGMQVKPTRGQESSSEDPMKSVLSLINPGTVLDGEVVMQRHLRRPVYIVFDVLSISSARPVLHLPFEKRLQHLKNADFRTRTADRDMFDISAVGDLNIALPLVRKNFVKRHELDNLLSKVVETKGLRSYKNGEVHNHLTDGIIFQPNLPYVCGTDVNLLKWKYLDTVTIDVEILPPRSHFSCNQNDDNDDDILHVGVLGEEGTMVDMTRFIHLPSSERRRLEADRHENRAKIAEVGFDPSTGEWYYLTMRPDKVASNHISTVLGTLLELAESLTTEELRYRMSVPTGTRDTPCSFFSTFWFSREDDRRIFGALLFSLLDD